MSAPASEIATGAAVAPPIMTLDGIRKSFGPVVALKGVDLAIRPREIHAIVGENGAGKSTLISIAAGVLRADAGTIAYNGKPVAEPHPYRLRQAGVSVTFQHPALAADLTVLENLRLVSPTMTDSEAKGLLDKVAIDELRMPVDRRVSELSLAQQHVVEIAGALSTAPKVLFLDEPTEPFQLDEIRKLFDLVKAMRDQGAAIVYVSHRLTEVMEIADRISVMRDGEIIDSRAADSITVVEIVTLIAGRPLGQVFPEKSCGVGNPILEARGLSGAGFSRVDFVAHSGEIVGLTGVEGEGQREFLRAIAGLGERSEGTLSLNGDVQHNLQPWALRSRGIGFIPDDRHAEGLFLALSIRENIGIGSLDRTASRGVIRPAAESAFGQDIVDQLRIRAPSVESLVADLSGGNQQKVLIGREMAARPQILLVDEPTKGVDVGARAEIYQRLRTLAGEGIAVVVCSSDGIELEGLCDRVLIFARGQIVMELAGYAVTDTSITEANLTATVSRAARSNEKRKRGRRRSLIATDHFPAIVLGVLIAIILAGTAAINPFFLSGFNISTMLAFLAIVAFISIGQMATILVGAIDLSVGALAGFVVVLASFLTPGDAGPLAIAAGSAIILACATAFGLFQGWLSTSVRIPAIVVTLASFVGLQGLSLALRPRAEGAISDALSDVAQFPLLGLPFGMLVAICVVVAFEWILYRHPLGRRLRAVGSNPLATDRLGINRGRHVLLAFALSGLLTGVGGLMLAGQVGIGSPSTGLDYTLMSITAVVLGGASVGGGRGSVVCTLMGAMLVQALSSASSFINSDSAVHYAVLGLMTLLAAIVFSVGRKRRSGIR